MNACVARLSGIYAILDEGDLDPVALAKAVLAGGVRIVQYRAKAGVVPQRLRALREMTRTDGALLIVNDHVDAALAFDADGVHLGPDDATATQLPAIRVAMAGRILGISCGTEDEARAAQRFSADYIGAGSVYATASKADAGAPIALAGLRRIAAACTLPVAAIGGITAQNLGTVKRCDVAMAAVLSAFSGSPDPQATASDFVRIWASQ